MDVELKNHIVAAVTLHPDRVSGLACFVVKDETELEKTAVLIAKSTDSMVHDLENGTYIVVRH